MSNPPCRWCRAAEPGVVLDLGLQPPADLFPPVTDPGPDPRWPLQMALCPRCGLAQLVDNPDSVSEPRGIEPAAMTEQATSAVATIVAAGLCRPGDTAVEFDSPHGGSWRALLREAGARDLTGDPAAAAVDLVVDVFGVMHDADQAEALRQRAGLLTPGGTLLLQFHSLASIVTQGQWNALRHGHFAYYATRVLVGMLGELGLTAVGAWSFELYGGTVLLAAVGDPSAARPVGQAAAAHLTALLARDDELAVTTAEGLRSLAHDADRGARALIDWLTAERDAGRSVLGYGAASRAVPLLVHAGVGPDLLPAVADGSPAKQGRRLPVSGIPIIAAQELDTRSDDVVLVFVPDLVDEVRRAFPSVEQRAGSWAVSEPVPRVVSR